MADHDRYGDEVPTGALHAESLSGRLVLRVVAADHVKQHPLPPKGDVIIGRGEKVDIAIDDPTVSRRHAQLRVGPQLLLTELSSRHGIKIGGHALVANQPAPLGVGQPFELGAVVAVVQRSGRAEAAAGRDVPVVADPAMVDLHRLVERFAAGNISVLLLGETGVGKEVTADLIHRRSPRAAKPMLRLNCAALTESLLESELFGHEKGAFTGAVSAKQGLFEVAQGGTVFLDEIGELPMTTQVRLLRVLEERKVTRVGGTKSIAIDVRFVAATHRDLQADIAAGKFRQDLYFRLNGVTLRIPPLRERVSEIEPLARAFGDDFAAQSNLPPPVFAPAVLARLRAHRWPGNIRELRNLMERAVLLAAGEPLTVAHFPLDEGASPGFGGPSERTAETRGGGELWGELQAVERQRIVDALTTSGGNQTRAAKLLGISRNTLAARIQDYGLTVTRKRDG